MHNRISPNKDSMLVIIALFVINACFAGTIPATPENITVTFLTPTTVRISWQTMIDLNAHPIEKYIVTYKSTDDSYRVVQDVAGNSGAVILDRLSPSTQYSIAVTAIWLGKKYRSRQIIFKTLDSAKISSQLEFSNGIRIPVNKMEKTINDSTYSDDVTSTATNTLSNGTHRELPTIRGVEIGIVLIVLMVWAGAIALFFNRWGKIRMLLPYQPDYKHEQLKVPGTGMCTGGVCNGQHSHQFESSECGALACQSLHYNSKNFRKLKDDLSTSVSERCSRSRINSAVFASSEDRGFDSIEFLRRHGSQSVLCRKAKSAENLRQNEAKQNSISNKMEWCADECSKAIKEHNNNDSTEIKLRRMSSAKQNEALLNSREEREVTARRFATNHSTAVTTFNVVIGSISIETPPTHLKGEHYLSDNSAGAQMVDHRHVKTLKPDSACRGDLADNDEEFIVVSREAKTHEPVHQCSPSLTISSPSPSIHAHTGPQTVNQGRGNKKVPTAAPMVSVSGPSSADGEDLVTECL